MSKKTLTLGAMIHGVSHGWGKCAQGCLNE